MGILYFIIIITMLIVVIVLMIGLGSFVIGGKFNHKYSNKLMRLRIIIQAIAIILILLFIAFNGNTPW